MAKPSQTEAERGTFRSIDRGTRARFMYEYLVEGERNMSEIAMDFYGTDKSQKSMYVSLVHRMYNFDSSGSAGRKNKGRFSAARFGCEVTLADVRAFVDKHPDGIDADFSPNPGEGLEMEEFLRKRCGKKTAVVSKKPSWQPPIKQAVVEDEDDYEEAYEDEYDDYEEDERPRRQRRNVDSSEAGYTVLGVGIGVLLIVLMFAFNWFGIRSLLVGLLLDVVPILWIVGSVILLIALVMDKVGIMEGRGFLAKGLFFVAIVVVTEVIGSHLMSFLMKFA